MKEILKAILNLLGVTVFIIVMLLATTYAVTRCIDIKEAQPMESKKEKQQ